MIPTKAPEDIYQEPVEELNAPPAAAEELSSATPVAAPMPTAGPRTYEDRPQPRKGESVFWIEVEKIEPNPYQPRRDFDPEALKELATSIREHGVLQPITVTKREKETPVGLDVRYELIAGERRWRAAQLAGLSQVPALIRRGVPEDRIKLELALIENVQREDLGALERAKAFKQLADEFQLVHREIGERMGKSREFVANTLRLLSLPAEVQEAISKNEITEGHGRAILSVGDDLAKQMQAYREILSDNLNVRESENRARQISGRTLVPKKRPARVQNPELKDWEHKLQEKLGTRVQLQKMGERGKIVMEFYSEEELRSLLHKLFTPDVRY